MHVCVAEDKYIVVGGFDDWTQAVNVEVLGQIYVEAWVETTLEM